MKASVSKWLTEQFGDDAALHAELYGQYVADMRSTFNAVETACRVSDMAALAQAAHTMKGLALQVGDGETADVCQALQLIGQGGDALRCEEMCTRLRALVGAL